MSFSTRPCLSRRPLVLIGAALATALAGQASAQAPADGIEEIIVTVRQRAESIQDVPGSVTAFSQSRIESSGIERARDFIAQTPGVSIVNAAEVADSQVNIRGINGARDAETNYALIIDGILMTNPAALNREYTNLQQIEVLKGPQGALYGRNAAAGAIIVTTEKPGEEWGGRFKGSMAEDNTWVLAGNVGGPVSDTLALSLGGSWRDTDGYYRNRYYATQLPGKDDAIVDNFESWDLTGRAIWEPTENLTVDAKLRYGEVDAASITFNSVFHIPSLVGFLEGAFGFPAEVAAFAYEDLNGHDFAFDNNIDPTNDQEATEFSVKADYDLGWANLTAWGLYSDIENDLSADGTSGAFQFFFPEQQCIDTTADLNAIGYQLIPPQAIGPTPGFSLFGAYTPTACDGTQYQVRNQEDISLELRLASKDDQRLRWLVGAYYLDLEREVGVNTAADRGFGVIKTLYTQDPANPTVQLVHDRFDTQVWAVFGQLAYDVTDTIEASLALRYDEEDRDVTSLVPAGASQTLIDTCGDGVGNPQPINPGLCNGPIADQNETFDEFQPKFSLTWDATDSITAFGSIGVGFKSGGFNNSGSAATIDNFINDPLINDPGSPFEGQFAPVNIQDNYQEETSLAWELGLKTNWLDNRLRAEVAYYNTQVDDMQFFEFVVGAFGLLRVVSNIDEVDIQGVEGSLSFQATDWLTVYAGGNILDSEIKKNSARPDTIGNESPYSPDFTWNAGADVKFPLTDELDFLANVEVNTVGETWFHVVQGDLRPTIFSLQFPLGPSNFKVTERDAYSLVNLRAGVGSDQWTLVAFLKNALDEEYLEEAIPAPEFGGTFDHPGTERRFGVEATYRF